MYLSAYVSDLMSLVSEKVLEKPSKYTEDKYTEELNPMTSENQSDMQLDLALDSFFKHIKKLLQRGIEVKNYYRSLEDLV